MIRIRKPAQSILDAIAGLDVGVTGSAIYDSMPIVSVDVVAFGSFDVPATIGGLPVNVIQAKKPFSGPCATWTPEALYVSPTCVIEAPEGLAVIVVPKPVVKHIVRGAIGVTKATLGIGKASDELIEQRRATCETCEKRRGAFCGVCGCSVPLKVRVKAERCPLGKW